MNHYGQQMLDHWRLHRPTELSRIADPITHFTAVGEGIQAAVTSLRDEILSSPRPGENPEELRHRSYQALRQAEELVLHDLLSTPTTEPVTTDDDQETLLYRVRLAAISRVTSRLAADWTEAPASQP